MKVKRLINSCQNIWKDGTLLDYNPQFKITFRFANSQKTEKYLITDYLNNDISPKIYVRSNQEVLSWKIIGIDEIEILVYAG